MSSNGDDKRLEGSGAFGEGQGPKGWYDNDGRLRGSDRPLPGKCGAHLRGTDPPRYCTRAPLKGRPSCALHGGKSLAGLAHPRAKGLAWSKYVPRGLARDYERLIRDPDLLSLRKEAAVLEALEAEQLRRMGEAGPPPWGKAVEALNHIMAAKDDAGRQAAMANLETVIRSGTDAAHDYEAAKAELREIMQEKVKVAAAESRRLHEADQFLTKEKAAALGHMVMLAVRDAVLDEATFAKGPRAVLVAVQDRMRRALGMIEPAGAVQALPAPDNGAAAEVLDGGTP